MEASNNIDIQSKHAGVARKTQPTRPSVLLIAPNLQQMLLLIARDQAIMWVEENGQDAVSNLMPPFLLRKTKAFCNRQLVRC